MGTGRTIRTHRGPVSASVSRVRYAPWRHFRWLIIGGGWWLLGVRYTKVYVQTTVAPTQKPKGSEQYEPVLKKAALDKATLDQARQALDKMEGEFSPQELAQAYEGPAKGDPSKAETLFRRILAVSGSTVSLVGSREKAFTAAFILAELAEGHGDYQAASRYNKQARELKPSGDTVQGHGFVGDDTPKLIFALKTIPRFKADDNRNTRSHRDRPKHNQREASLAGTWRVRCEVRNRFTILEPYSERGKGFCRSKIVCSADLRN